MPEEIDFNKDLVEAGLKPGPAKCPICDKKFKNERSLPSHMKTAHGKSNDFDFAVLICDSINGF